MKYRKFFEKHGIDVDKYCVEVPESFHKNWLHRAGDNWTTKWRNWIDNNLEATTKEVYQQAGKMMDEYGIQGAKLIDYK